jgi:uncharacterized membrane protein
MYGIFIEFIQIFLFSMIPSIEARYVVPLLAIHQFGWEWWQAMPVSIAGNIFLVPFILLFFKRVELYLNRYSRFQKAMDWGFPLVRRRADSRIKKYEELALVIFVSIPLPLTGAGLGSLIAYLFDLPIKKSFFMILIGVIISTTITTVFYLSTRQLLFY